MSFNQANKPPEFKRLCSISLSGKELAQFVSSFTKQGKCIRFRAKGSSMFPFIKDNDTVTVSPYTDQSPEVGDIVAFIDSKTEKLVIHRLLSIRGSEFQAKGDNCNRWDTSQSVQSILGNVNMINHNKLISYIDCYLPTKKLIALLSKLGFTEIIGKLFNLYANFRNGTESI